MGVLLPTNMAAAVKIKAVLGMLRRSGDKKIGKY